MSDQVKILLSQLEAELKQQQLWRLLPPDPAALASTLPFCVDTLELQSWLQFIFIPRMRALLDANAPLPGNISILPIAEEAFKTLGEQAQPLLRIIEALDNNGRAAQ